MIRIAIECDGCGERPAQTVKNGKHAIHQLRRRAAELGWSSPGHSGKDYCPACARAKVPSVQK